MTAPTITYRHKFCSDLTAATEIWEGNSWTWTESTGIDLINILAADITATYPLGDVMQIQLDCDNAATVESGFYCYPDKSGANDLDFSTTDYPFILIRYFTSESTAGAHAKVVVAFDGYDNGKTVAQNITDGNAQLVLDNAYSTTWAVEGVALTSGKTLDHVLLFAECDTDTANGTYYVYYDFVLICVSSFTFPFVDRIVRVPMRKKVAIIEIPGRDSDIIQDLGMNSPRLRLEGTMDASATNWGSPYGSILYAITRGSTGGYHDPWQWFTSDVINCKVTPAPEGFVIAQDKDAKAQRTWTLDLILYSLSSLDETTWDNLQWAGQ